MREIEVKVLDIDVKKVVKKLKEMGAKKVFSGQIESAYFDYKNNQLLGKGIVLRIRRQNKKCKLTLKKIIKKNHAREMKEIEVEITEPKKIEQLLSEIGLINYYSDKRKRTSFELNGTKFDIDIYPHIPPFMEIEALTEKQLKKTIKEFRFPEKNVKSWTTKDLLNYYKK